MFSPALGEVKKNTQCTLKSVLLIRNEGRPDSVYDFEICTADSKNHYVRRKSHSITASKSEIKDRTENLVKYKMFVYIAVYSCLYQL